MVDVILHVAAYSILTSAAARRNAYHEGLPHPEVRRVATNLGWESALPYPITAAAPTPNSTMINHHPNTAM
jgi:hypothetical protein